MSRRSAPQVPPAAPIPPDPVKAGVSSSSTTVFSATGLLTIPTHPSKTTVSASSAPLSGSAPVALQSSAPSSPDTVSAPLSCPPLVLEDTVMSETSQVLPVGQEPPNSSANPGDPAPLNSSSPGNGNFNWAKNLSSASKFPESKAPVSTSENGRPRVKISNAVFERGAKLHNDYIVGIFYGKAMSYGKIWGVLNYLWGKDRRVTIHHLSKNVFLFYIPSPALRKRVLQHELWRVGDSPFFVTEWKAEFSTNPPSLDRAPVWATIQRIPFDLITPEGLSCICRPLGRVVDSKPFRSISSAEVKVIVDLTKPLPSEMEIECEDGTVQVLRVIYPWLPPLCAHCNEIGHKINLCPSAPEVRYEDKSEKKEQYVKGRNEWKAARPNKSSPKKDAASSSGKSTSSGNENASSGNENDMPTNAYTDSLKEKITPNPAKSSSTHYIRASSHQGKELLITDSARVNRQGSAKAPSVLVRCAPTYVSNSFDALQYEDMAVDLLVADHSQKPTPPLTQSVSLSNGNQKKRKVNDQSYPSQPSPIRCDILPIEWKKATNLS